MAGDWIKFRGELFQHPKFLALSDELVYGDDPGLLIYTCGLDALGIGAFPPSNESNEKVTDRALRCVTESALRCVTMASLLRVWCAVDAHCKIEGGDVVMRPMLPHGLDDIAGFSGFGKAMIAVGWAAQRQCKVLVFPDFLKFNEPACLRSQPKTNAERQREWRDRKQGEAAPPKVTVTKVTKSNGEKRRVEKSKGDTNVSPPGGGGFNPPDVTQVEEYCRGRQNSIDAAEFHAFYASKGWMVGKNRMKDWKQAVITWEIERKKREAPPKPFKCRPLTSEEMARDD
jgi:hypothetical protein